MDLSIQTTEYIVVIVVSLVTLGMTILGIVKLRAAKEATDVSNIEKERLLRDELEKRMEIRIKSIEIEHQRLQADFAKLESSIEDLRVALKDVAKRSDIDRMELSLRSITERLDRIIDGGKTKSSY